MITHFVVMGIDRFGSLHRLLESAQPEIRRSTAQCVALGANSSPSLASSPFWEVVETLTPPRTGAGTWILPSNLSYVLRDKSCGVASILVFVADDMQFQHEKNWATVQKTLVNQVRAQPFHLQLS